MAKLQSIKSRLNSIEQREYETISPAKQSNSKSWRAGKNSNERGYTYKWRKARLRFLQSNPLCVYCESRGIIKEANVVDHIKPHQGNQELFWDESNWQALCATCHNTIKQAEERGSSTAWLWQPEWLKPVPRLTIVFGPCGSGKSTWVNGHANEDDVVLDLDVLIADISGKDMYRGNKQDFGKAVRKRNSMLMDMAVLNASGYLILTGSSKEARQWWVNKLNPKHVHVMDTSIEECHNRIMNDARRPMSVKRQQIQSLSKWEVQL